jgi:hypothetical protein
VFLFCLLCFFFLHELKLNLYKLVAYSSHKNKKVGSWGNACQRECPGGVTPSTICSGRGTCLGDGTCQCQEGYVVIDNDEGPYSLNIEKAKNLKPAFKKEVA